MKTEIVFLCDQEADCKTSPRCGKECIRTTNIEHAKNFAFVSVSEEKSAYIETAVGIAKLSEDATRKFSLQVQTEIGGEGMRTCSNCKYSNGWHDPDPCMTCRFLADDRNNWEPMEESKE